MFKKTAISVLVAIVIIGGGYFLLNNQKILNPSSSTSISQSDWKTYENTAFKYRIRHPNNTDVDPYDRYDYITPIVEKSPVSVDSVNIMAWGGAGTTGFSAEENKHFINLDLKSFAEAIRTYQVNAQNPNVKNKRVGDLQEMTSASSTAYSFTLSETFANGEGGYLIPSGIINRYIFLESPDKRKFMIWYPKNDFISQKIVDSFTFTNN